ncbi:MAG: Flp family type IVb pilin [Planctomycetota bacterium]
MVSYVHARLKGKTMRDIFRDIKRLLREESGATATEYAVMVALVIIVVIASIAAVGTKVSGMYVDSEQGW